MLDYVIIDPSYVEFNRGSHGYLPYILYGGLKEQGYNVELFEDFTIPNLEYLPEAKHYYIALWAYPQMDAAFVIQKFLPGKFSFFGYYPLIDHLKLPKYIVPDEIILKGITSFPKYYYDHTQILGCDCDLHLQKYDDGGQVYPLFTAYGCPNRCAFCPATVNCDYKRIEAPISDVYDSLDYCISEGYMNIHFTDEDLFHDIGRAYAILHYVYDRGMKFIALATVTKVQKFLDTYGEEPLIRSGVKIVEVGFETADETIATSMHKPKKDKYILLRESLKETDIFWLTLTFFPGETISSLNKTGEFLKQYGHKVEDVYSRIATNSTEGGLGQFMQIYHGVKDYDKLIEHGIHLSNRPIRLLPSFIPWSFVDSVVKEINPIKEEHLKWFQMYKVDPSKYKIKKGWTIENLLQDIGDDADGFVFFAICARLGIIK